MNEEQKIRGGGNPELNDAALDAVTGGMEGMTLRPCDAADQSWDFMKKKFGVDEGKEEQP